MVIHLANKSQKLVCSVGISLKAAAYRVPAESASPVPTPRSAAPEPRSNRSSAAIMASQPSAYSPPARSSSISYERKCIVLVDWWLERMHGKIYISGLTGTPYMSNGTLSFRGNRKSPARVFKCAINKRYDYTTVETVKGFCVSIGGPLNDTRMRENGFSEKVYRSFMAGLPVQWNQLVDSNMEQTDEHPESPSNSADEAFVDYHYKKFMSGDFDFPKPHIFAEKLDPCRNPASSDLGESVTPNLCRALVKFEDTSEKNTGRKLRSGRVLPISVPLTGRNSQKRTQQKASNNKG